MRPLILPILVVALLETAPALANAPSPEPGVSSGTFLQSLFALGLIVALLGTMAWVARRISGGRGFGGGGMKLIGGISLGPKERIVLVEIGEEWLVIGLVPGQIRTLHRLAKGKISESSEIPQDFSLRLKQMIQRGGHE